MHNSGGEALSIGWAVDSVIFTWLQSSPECCMQVGEVIDLHVLARPCRPAACIPAARSTEPTR